MRLAAILSVILLGCSDPMTGADAARDATSTDAARLDAVAVLDAPALDLPDVPAGEVERTVARLEQRIKAKSHNVTRVFIEIQSRKGPTAGRAPAAAPEDSDMGSDTGSNAAPPGSAVPA